MNPEQPAWKVILIALILFLLTACGSIQGSESALNTPQPSLAATTPTPIPLPTLEPLLKEAELEVSRGPVYSLAWSPDGTRLASTGYKRVILWDVQTKTELITLEDHTAYVWGVDWAPDGGMFASAGRDGKVRIWDGESYQELASLPAGDAFCVNWSPDGALLASGTSSARVAIWDPDTGNLVQKWQGKSLIISLDWSPDGSMIAAGQLDGIINLYDLQQRK